MQRRILDAATITFIKRGYRNTRIDAVAARAEVSVGTIYRYAATKEALFELVLRDAFLDPGVPHVVLPYQATSTVGVVEQIWDLLKASTPFEQLHTALGNDAPEDVAAEFEGIMRELYQWQFRYWRALKLIERCAQDWPELAMLFYQRFRRTSLDAGARYIEMRTRARLLRPMPDAAVAARVISENCAFFAMHRHTAPDSDISDELAEETVVRVLCNAFLPTSRDRPTVDPHRALSVPRG